MNARWFAFGLVAAVVASGCSSDRVDPPRKGEEEHAEAPEPEVDSLDAWAKRARDRWASGDTLKADAAAAVARDAFAAAWTAAGEDLSGSNQARTAERLPVVQSAIGVPSAAKVAASLEGAGLHADIVEAAGAIVLWQVIVSDPVGGANASTEFWAWPRPDVPDAAPIVQTLPASAPARLRYGPDAVGALWTWRRPTGDAIASAWMRPRATDGLEIALAERPRNAGKEAGFRVTSNRILPVAADTVRFEAGGDAAPALVVIGAGTRDVMFDDCAACPRLERHQRYVYSGKDWTLSQETVASTPYASVVAFVHAIAAGTPDAALPYAAGADQIEQAKGAGIDSGFRGPLRASPGTNATDLTQRFRLYGTKAVEFTVQPRGTHWVVSDVRPSEMVIE